MDDEKRPAIIEPSEDVAEDLSDDVARNYTDNDRRDMKRMGKKQELLRNFRIFTCMAIDTSHYT
jgi:hypothetical protein